MKTQTEMILQALKRRKKSGITPLFAIHKLGITRLGARIYDLKNEGHQIASELVKVKTRHDTTTQVACYKLSSGGQFQRIDQSHPTK